MARATLQLVPFNVAVLVLVEFALSLTLLHVLLELPSSTDLLPDQANGLSGNGAVMAAILLLVVGISIRVLFGIVAHYTQFKRRILVVGQSERVGAVIDRICCHRARQFDVLEASPTTVSWMMLRQLRIWRVILAIDPHQTLPQALLDCKMRGIKVMSDQTFQERHLGRLDLDTLTTNELLLCDGFAGGPISAACKRSSDILLAIAILLVTLPLMALTALAIKVDTRGPVFYRQVRIGAFGRPFTIFKFRSMTVDAEIGDAPRWAQKQDPRITSVGALIRATRIDELAQLANIIRGDMSLVGPRPERPHFVEELTRVIPFYRERSYVKPGLTGWAQVNFPYGASIEDAREKLAYDLYYVKHRSLLLDLRILLATVRVVLMREGAR